MGIKNRIVSGVRGITKRWGPSTLKRGLWDEEYASGKWTHCEHTGDDPLYGLIEKYCRKGSILDLGCGSGNTSNELNFKCYEEYVGMDISQVAIEKAAVRSEKNGRGTKNKYVQSDILGYVPSKKHDVILFRDSINNVPRPKVLATLDRYVQYLKPEGVLIVRLSGECVRDFQELMGSIEAKFKVVDKYAGPECGGVITLVFR